MFRLIGNLFRFIILGLAFYGGYTLYNQFKHEYFVAKLRRTLKYQVKKTLKNFNHRATNHKVSQYFSRGTQKTKKYNSRVSSSYRTSQIPSFSQSDSGISSIRRKVCSVALTYVNTPYVHGGTGYRGLDCSGLVYAVYKRVLNVKLPRTVDGLYDIATKVTNPLPGDLVFFKIKHFRVDHVGIYLGNGKMIHASSHKGVCVVSLKEKYYRTYFYGFGRLIIGE